MAIKTTQETNNYAMPQKFQVMK